LLTGIPDLICRSTFLSERSGPLWADGGPVPYYVTPLGKLEGPLLSCGIAGRLKLADLRRRVRLQPDPGEVFACSWIEQFNHFLALDGNGVSASKQIPFARSLQPFLSGFLLQRDARLKKFLAPSAFQCLVDALARQLSNICAMTLYCTLSDETGTAEPSRESYRKFEDSLLQGGWWALARRYPVMARLITERAAFFGQATDELFDRFYADRGALAECFLPGCLEQKICDIDPGKGDLHNSGRSVTRLQFEDGAVVYYKRAARPLLDKQR
jgi:lantibiotic modifying enzyme